MKFSVITLFPEMFDCFLSRSIIGRAIEEKKIKVDLLNPRDFCDDPHKRVDDKPYGGGPGMVIKAIPVLRAWEKAKNKSLLKKIFQKKERVKTIFFSPGGEKFTNAYARSLAANFDHVILISGRYEGIDYRVVEATGAELISVGDYILTGGEVPGMIVIDSVTRQIDGVLGKKESLEETRKASQKVYTRPEVIRFNGKEYSVPEILLSGDHKRIEEWREEN